jgi:predicted Zn finger-like uncharacterized protein
MVCREAIRMQLQCPHCSAPIQAENINIQEMLAVCSECHHVFEFSRSAVARKAKGRKLKPPNRVRVHEDDECLELSYWLVFGPGPKFGMVMSLIALVVYGAMLIGAWRGNASAPPLLVIGLLMLLFAYLEAVFLTTTTRISLDADQVAVTSGPLPFPLKDDKTLSVHDVARVFSKRATEAMPPFLPTHNVYAELHDGEEVPVVTSLPREYARYIAATLDDYLHAPESGDVYGDADARIDATEPAADLSLHEEAQAAHNGRSA